MAIPLVIDIGTAFTKVGFVGEESPKWVIFLGSIDAVKAPILAPILGSIVKEFFEEAVQ